MTDGLDPGLATSPTYTRDEVLAAATQYFMERHGHSEEGARLPASVWTDKYALRDKEGRFHELTPDDMHWRFAREFARIEAQYPNPRTAEELFPYFQNFDYVVPQGSPSFGIGNPYQLVSISNCSVRTSPQDTLSDIMAAAQDLASLYKRRFGAGLDISGLRPDGASVNNAAVTSTGAHSFMDLYSYVTRMVGQNSRRGALMLTIDVRHPDVEKFITKKADKTLVTGANVSVKVSDDFMEAVEADHDYLLHWPIGATGDDIQFSRVVRARDLFTLIAEQATANAEPGVLFWDTIQRNLPLDFYREQGFETISTNP